MNSGTIIVGGGQAGVQTAASLRQGGYAEPITLVGKEIHTPYQRPPLSKQVIKKEWTAERCQLRKLEFYEKNDISLKLGMAASAVDPESKQLILEDGSQLGFDHLAICTGSSLNRLNIEGAQLPGVYYLRTIDDSLSLTDRFSRPGHVAIIGGGYIGLEVAAAARTLGCDVTVIEALDRVMKRSALPEIGAFFHQRHESEGVSFLFNSRISSLKGDAAVEAVVLEDGTEIPAETVMVGIGVRPEVNWLEGSGIELDRGIRIDNYCRTNYSNIFAAGDVTEMRHPLLEGRQVLESVQNAISQGKIIAANILGNETAYTEVPWFWSEQYDCRLQMAGIPRAQDTLVRRENPDTGALSIFSVSSGLLNAVQCINAPMDYMVGRQMIGSRTEVNEAALIDHNINLKELL